MTEEQKEYEANRLANLMHKLSDLGVVKPGKIGPNGTTRIFRLILISNNCPLLMLQDSLKFAFLHFRHSYFC